MCFLSFRKIQSKNCKTGSGPHLGLLEGINVSIYESEVPYQALQNNILNN